MLFTAYQNKYEMIYIKKYCIFYNKSFLSIAETQKSYTFASWL